MKRVHLRSLYIKLFSIFIISSVGLIAYSDTFNCSFHFDDQFYIIDNFVIRNIHNLLTHWQSYPCRFITYLSIVFNYHFNGLNVFGYHLFNLGIHLASAILVWWLVLLTLSTPAMKKDKIVGHADLIALFAGLVFVSHPLQTQAVTYIWQRAASMAAMFYLASLCLYVKSRLIQIKTQHSNLGASYYILSLIMAILAMFTKENTLTLPLMVLLYEFSFFETNITLNWPSLRTLIVTRPRLSIFFLTLFVIPLTALLSIQGKFLEIQGFTGSRVPPPFNYLLTQGKVLVTYIRLMFLPLHQNLDYDYPISTSFFEWPVLIGFLSLSGILFYAKYMFPKYRLISFSIFWFFLTLAPESSFWPLQNVIDEHRLYLPSTGYCMLLVSCVYYLTQRKTIKTMVIILTIIVSFYSILTFQRNKVWNNGITLWSDAVSKSPHKARPHYNLGVAYQKSNDFSQSILQYNKTIEINPVFTEAYTNLCAIYFKQGKFSQAMSDCTKAIELDPESTMAYLNRAIIWNQEGNLTQAVSDYNKAIELNSNHERIYRDYKIHHDYKIYYANQNFLTQALSGYNKTNVIRQKLKEAYYNHGNAYAQHGDFTQAISNYTNAINIDTNFTKAYNNRGNIFSQRGDIPKALSDYNKAIEIDPNYAEAYINRGNTYSQQGNFTQALLDYNKAITINPHNAQAYSNRAIAYYLLREYNKAWDDVHTVEALRRTVNPHFINALKHASGQDK